MVLPPVQATILEPKQKRPAHEQSRPGDFPNRRHLKPIPNNVARVCSSTLWNRRADDRHDDGVGAACDEGHDMNPK